MVAPFFVQFKNIFKKNVAKVFLFAKCVLTLHQHTMNNMKNNLKNLIALPFGYDSINEMSTLVKCYYYFKNNGYNVKLVDGDSIEVEVKNLKSPTSIFVKIAEIDIKYYSNLYAKSFN